MMKQPINYVTKKGIGLKIKAEYFNKRKKTFYFHESRLGGLSLSLRLEDQFDQNIKSILARII